MRRRQGSRPELDERMIGRRIEVVCHYTLPDGVFGEALMWCSGEVVDLDQHASLRALTRFSLQQVPAGVEDALLISHLEQLAGDGLPLRVGALQNVWVAFLSEGYEFLSMYFSDSPWKSKVCVELTHLLAHQLPPVFPLVGLG